MAASNATQAGDPTYGAAHHFNNLRQQQATVRFGMWMFLITEVLFFAGIFCAYTAYRIWYPREFEAGSSVLNIGIASVNTILLLTSSLTMTLAIRAAYEANIKMLRIWLVSTIILGAVFLGLKMREYQLDYQEGLIPAPRDSLILVEDEETGQPRQVPYFDHHFVVAAEEAGYDIDGVNVPRVQLFFIFYYSMTGLHVLHMIIGLGLLTWQYVLARIGFFRYGERYIYVEVMSLYWHFVDMVWMFLLPLLYFAGPHTFDQAVHGFKLAIGMVHH